MGEKQRRVAYGALGIFIFLCIWYAATTWTSLGEVMPDPITVFSGFFIAFVEPIGTHSMIIHILISLRRMLIPYVIGGVLGVLVGILMGWYKIADAILMPYIQAFRPIPPIAWIPLSIVWFGFDESSKYFLIFLACFFTIALTTYTTAFIRSMRRWCGQRACWAPRITSCSPRLYCRQPCLIFFSGLQVALGSAWATIVAAEMIRSSEGVGWLIISGQEVGNMTQIMVGIVAIAADRPADHDDYERSGGEAMRMDSERQVTEQDALIEFRNVDKYFNKPEEGQYQVVGDLNIKVRENEFLVLFGPGQCGKSTILNLIAGFEMPSSGEILCQGKQIEGPGPERGMVFQNTALFPWLTVMGNVEYGPKVRGIKKEETLDRVLLYRSGRPAGV